MRVLIGKTDGVGSDFIHGVSYHIIKVNGAAKKGEVEHIPCIIPLASMCTLP